MNKFRGLSLLTKRLDNFLKVIVLRRVARDSRLLYHRSGPLNLSAILRVDERWQAVSTVSRREKHNHVATALAVLRTALIAQLRRTCTGFSGTHCLTTGIVE